MMSIAHGFCVTILAATSSAPLAAASEGTPFGPSGGAVRALVQHAAGGALYAGTYAGGVFNSSDAGASWAAVAPAIRG